MKQTAAFLLLCLLAACREDPPPPPSLTSISPARGLITGGTEITLSGSNLANASAVTVGGVAASNVRVNGDGTQVQAVTGAGPRGPGDVQVVTPGGAAALAGAFVYFSGVTVDSIDPTVAETVGTTTVVVRGSGLVQPVSATFMTGTSSTVFPGGLGTELAVPFEVSGLLAGTYDVRVTNGDGEIATLTGAFTVTASEVPVIDVLVPSRGLERGGNQVRLQGSLLTGATALQVGSTSVTGFQVNGNGTEIVFTMPAGTRGAADVMVTTPAGVGSLTGGYVYTRPVVVTSASPPQVVAGAGAQVTLNGTGMVSPVRVTVALGAVPQSVTVVNATETATVISLPPLAAGDYAVSVINGDGESGALADPLRVRAGLVVSAVSPAAGFSDESTPIEIEGPDLGGITEVRVGTSTCGSLALVTSRRITCTVPPVPAGAHDVVVRRGTAAEGVLAAGFTAVSPTDTTVRVLGVVPGGGRSSGGQTVEVVATGLTAAATATMDGAATSAPTLVSGGRRLRVTTPAVTLASGTLSRRVPVALTVGATTVTAAGAFRYHLRPVFTAVTPAAGATVGGDLVTVTGDGFSAENTSVTFDGAPCTAVTVTSPTQLTCRIPAHAAGQASITVTNEFDTGAPVAAAFDFVDAVRITSMDPPVFSIAGGARVEATGSGFAASRMRITIVGESTTITQFDVLSATRMRFTVPAHAAGVVTFRLEDTGRTGQPFSTGDAPATFVDPTEPAGGVTGGPIARNIFVSTVRDDTGARVAGASVFVGPSWGAATYRGTTNANGLLVLAADALAGPVTLTALATGFGATTLVDINGRDVTFRLNPHVAQAPPAPTLATVSGTVTGWENAGYPTGAQPGRFKRVAAVWATEAEPGVLPVPPGVLNVIAESPCDVTNDGINNPLPNQFTVTVRANSTIALMAAVYFWDSVDGTCSPGVAGMQEGLAPLTALAMGMQGPITVGPGTNPGQVVPLDYPVTLSPVAALSGAPSSTSGATVYTADAIFDIDTMGSFTFTAGLATMANVGFAGSSPTYGFLFLPPAYAALAPMPTGIPVTGGFPPLTLHGVAATASGAGFTLPLSEVFRRNVQTETTTLTGFFSIPGGLSPAESGALVARRFQWNALGRPDHVVVVDVSEVLGVDGNGAPILMPAWTVMQPASVTSATLPVVTGVPSGEDLAAGVLHVWQLRAVAFAPQVTWSWDNHTDEPMRHQRDWDAQMVTKQVGFYP